MSSYKFEEIGRALNKIAQKLNKDKQLCRLLKYMESNPLSSELDDWDDTISLVNTSIRIIPKARLNEVTEPVIVITIPTIELHDNIDFSSLTVQIDVLCPIDKWQIDDICPRPFKIMQRIYDCLQASKVTGIGTMQFLAAEQSVIYEGVSDNQMVFQVTANG